MLFSRSSRASPMPGAATRRLTIVGAAKKHARVHAPSRAKISSASNPPDSGTTWTAPREHVRQHVQARAVRQRRRMEDRVARRDRLDIGEEAPAHREQIAVRDHDALGTPRRTARVEQPRRIVGDARRGLRSRRRFEQRCIFGASEFDAPFEHRLAVTRFAEGRVPCGIDEGPACAAVCEHVGKLAPDGASR